MEPNAYELWHVTLGCAVLVPTLLILSVTILFCTWLLGRPLAEYDLISHLLIVLGLITCFLFALGLVSGAIGLAYWLNARWLT